MINYLLSRKQRITAAAYPYRPEVRQVTVDDVSNAALPIKESRLTAIILSVKTPKKKTRELRLSGKPYITYKYYKHLILCRELTKGGLFYLLSTSDKESARLFGYDCKSRYVGAYAVVYEPQDTRRLIFGVPLLRTHYPLMPACKPDTIKFDTTPIVGRLEGTTLIDSFFIEVSDLKLNRVILLPACGSALCDGGHARNVLCPGLFLSSRLYRKTLSISVSTASGGLSHVRFQSCDLATLFIDKNLLKQSKEIHVELLPSIAATLKVYAKGNVSFLVAGWYKRLYDDSPQVPEIHISMICPRKRISDILLINSTMNRLMTIDERCWEDVILPRWSC